MSRAAALPAFVAIDFETADHGRDSACAVAIVRVEGREIVRREHRLIRPPRRHFLWTHIHGIRWVDVERERRFGAIWPELVPLVAGAELIAAHNAPFDKGVLRACCEAAGHAMPEVPFLCTVKLARATWNLRPTTLPDVCKHLGIGLKHHDALSDAEACARIVLASGRWPASRA
jgi:DNA polymerase-3 subunit epsilon